jgi:hypothetical protein
MSVHGFGVEPWVGSIESALNLPRSVAQLIGSSGVEQVAHHPETIARWDGRLHERADSNMRSCRTNRSA